MSSLSNMLDRMRGLDLERALGLHPNWPQVALDVDRDAISLVRLKRKRRGRPILDGHYVQPLDEAAVPATIFDQDAVSDERLGQRLRALFDASSTRPSRVSLVLPDNLAKIALLPLPEWPPSRKQLLEIIRFKMHRAVPFRLNESSLSFQVLAGEGKGINVLVVLMRQSLVDKYERALESIGARPGLIDLCTPNLLNLCRGRIEAAAGADGDVGLLNCCHSYFSLVIVRNGRLIFFRCKTYSVGEGEPTRANGFFTREVSNSLSYYQEKLAGSGIGTLLVRTVSMPYEQIAGTLGEIGVQRVELVDPLAPLRVAEGTALEPATTQRIAPAIGAATGRT